MKYYLLIISVCIFFTKSVEAQVSTAYQSHAVSFKSADGAFILSGTLTLPEGAANAPAVVLVSGIGKQDRNGTIAGHPIFAQLSEQLSSHGIAVLRLDDRGTGKTTGLYETATTADFADDALMGIHFLKNLEGINPARIGLLGHSEGGMAVATAAAKSKHVAFLVSVAGQVYAGADAAKTLAKIQVPILALHGDKDVVADAEKNLDNWKNYSAVGGNRKVRTVMLSGLNHLFLPCRTCTIGEYATLRSDFSMRAANIITRWIHEIVAKP